MSESEEDVEYSDELLTFALDSINDKVFSELSGRVLSKSELIATAALREMKDNGVSKTTQNVDSVEAENGKESSSTSQTSDRKSEEDSFPLPADGSIVDSEAGANKRRKYLQSISNYVSKKDVRHTYAKAYMDACNSGNKYTYARMLQEIATPDVKLVSVVMTPTDSFLPKSVEIVGWDTQVVAFETFIKSTPDCYFDLLSSKIKVFRNGESAIICKFTMVGTRVFEINGLPEGTDDTVVLTKMDDSESLNGQFEKLQVNAEITSRILETNSKKPVKISTNIRLGLGEVHTVKAPVSIIGTNTLYVNAEKKVFRIEGIVCNNALPN